MKSFVPSTSSAAPKAALHLRGEDEFAFRRFSGQLGERTVRHQFLKVRIRKGQVPVLTEQDSEQFF